MMRSAGVPGVRARALKSLLYRRSDTGRSDVAFIQMSGAERGDLGLLSLSMLADVTRGTK